MIQTDRLDVVQEYHWRVLTQQHKVVRIPFPEFQIVERQINYFALVIGVDELGRVEGVQDVRDEGRFEQFYVAGSQVSDLVFLNREAFDEHLKCIPLN